MEEAIVPQQVGSDVNPAVVEPAASDSSTPETAQDSTTEEAAPQEEPKLEDVSVEDANLPFGKHPRWQKMLSSNRELKAENATLKQRVELLGDRDERAIQGLLGLEEWMRTDPKNARAVYDLMMGDAKASEEEAKADPYEAYDPDVAAKFRELDELKQFMQQQKEREEQRVQGDVETHIQDLNSYFDSKLKADGYLNEKGEAVNPDALELIEQAALSKVMALAEKKKWVSKEDIDAVYTSVMRGFSAAEKQGLKKAVAPAVVPASGSRAGVPVSSKKPQTAEDRINLIANADWSKL